MNGITFTLRALHRGESRLSGDLLTVAQRHRADHEVHHVAGDVARWSQIHTREIAATGKHYGLDLGEDADPKGGVLTTPREGTADVPGGRAEPGLLLLNDLRDLYLGASDNSLHWEMLAQVAQAARDSRLLDLGAACHPQTLRQIRWFNTMIKDLSPQILTSW